MGNRKTLSKKIRFEVFKRDKFTCQYCGRTAPDVVLEIDHIEPISKGGSDDIMNLITSCFDCNRGKSNRKLTQDDEMKKQQKMLLELAERKEQIEMMLKWKKELENLEDVLVDKIEELLSVTGDSFTDYGRKVCKRDIKKYGFEEVYESTKISLEQYFVPGDKESIKKTFEYIGRICSTRHYQKNNPNAYDIAYLCKIGENRLNYFNKGETKIFLNRYYKKEDFEDLKYIFSDSNSRYELQKRLEQYYGDD